ncbi:hypothetical protein Gpo141_00000411 [Globisporangium polare]
MDETSNYQSIEDGANATTSSSSNFLSTRAIISKARLKQLVFSAVVIIFVSIGAVTLSNTSHSTKASTSGPLDNPIQSITHLTPVTRSPTPAAQPATGATTPSSPASPSNETPQMTPFVEFELFGGVEIVITGVSECLNRSSRRQTHATRRIEQPQFQLQLIGIPAPRINVANISTSGVIEFYISGITISVLTVFNTEAQYLHLHHTITIRVIRFQHYFYSSIRFNASTRNEFQHPIVISIISIQPSDTITSNIVGDFAT